MRTDFDLPPPTITKGEALARLPRLAPWHILLIRDQRRLLRTQTPARKLTRYYFRQLVEYGELAYERSEAEQTFFNFGEKP